MEMEASTSSADAAEAPAAVVETTVESKILFKDYRHKIQRCHRRRSAAETPISQRIMLGPLSYSSNGACTSGRQADQSR